ncbi:hypothetical protein MAELSTROM_44 [Pseudoalteromonas phage Maelstrom]|uniref:baseplate spike n=1 Tax=Pseudoalteromonas phage Maelstrom TaxID=2065202 RepID=UPI000CA25DD6|nr:baseplate spike [Pseudoalteromonas phage Maelstrom]AUG84963.1 hypothetical protein MAELSTROM_44 [Pseudoalteromonas phage Maelstrom]
MIDEIDDNENLLPDLVRDIMNATKRAVEVSLPCIVTKVISRTKVNVRPLIKVVMQDGTSRQRDIIEGLPIATFGAGDKFISFNVTKGDIGWLDACDRDISLFLQSYANVEPPTSRMHSFSDARFVPDIMTNITVAEEDAAAMVISTRDGTVKIALDNDEVRIKNNDTSVIIGVDNVNVATSSVVIDITGDSVTGVAPGGFNLNGFTIDASGAAVSPVSMTAPSMMAAGKELAGHKHKAGTPPDETGENI